MRILHDSEIERRFLFLSELYAQSLRTEQGDTWVKSVGLFYLPRHLWFCHDDKTNSDFLPSDEHYMPLFGGNQIENELIGN